VELIEGFGCNFVLTTIILVPSPFFIYLPIAVCAGILNDWETWERGKKIPELNLVFYVKDWNWNPCQVSLGTFYHSGRSEISYASSMVHCSQCRVWVSVDIIIFNDIVRNNAWLK
jgi:hypothetical protein